uniref:Uncharacterized protein n=1 Tax=Thalassionema nitzschioides TaxID=33649 RepID=A0A7S1E1G2_9STRA|mmetsp:Transcript_15165/g.22352  ORF Transcript_15165/g.22352 Transcript_15165/m.22352 type:complete len:107 (-) Transcript_15165:168-488(-)
MVSRLLVLVILALVALSTQAFTVPAIGLKSAAPSFCTSLEGCRSNAKKEKIKRNRENMRKFKSPGKRGLSRRKMLKKAQAANARAKEAEFIAKCFSSIPPPNTDGK